MKMITISNNEIEEIKAKAKKNKNKHIDKKLQVLILRYEGKSNEEISARTGYNERYITKLIRRGYKVAIAEQIGDPKSPGLTKREVIKVINNLLAAQGFGQCCAVERPCVDMRVDAEIGCCTIKKSLTLLPC